MCSNDGHYASLEFYFVSSVTLIMGAGPIGLVSLLAARAFGAPRVAIVDVDEHRLAVARSLGRVQQGAGDGTGGEA